MSSKVRGFLHIFDLSKTMVKQASSLLFLLLFKLLGFAQDSTISKYVTLIEHDTASYSAINLEHFEDYRFKYRLFNTSMGNIGLPTNYLDSISLPNYNGFFQGYSSSLFENGQIKFYQQQEDVTLLQYINGAKKEQYFRVFHSNQFGKGLNLSFDYNRIISEGFYLNQLTDNTHFNTSLNYQTKNQKYRLKIYYLISNLKVQENGGISFTDSTGEGITNSDLLNVNLSAATKKMRSQSVYLGQEFMLLDSSFIGAIRLLQESELAWSWKWYKDKGITNYYNSIYLDSTKTFDSIHALQFRNSIGFSLFDNRLKLKFEHQYHTYTQDSIFDTIYNSDFAIGQFNQNFGKFNIDIQTRIGISGYNEGDYLNQLEISYRIDTISKLAFSGNFQVQSPFYWQNRFSGNHVRYAEQFSDEKLNRFAVLYSNSKLKGAIGINHSILKNSIYYNYNGTPSQYKNGISKTQFFLNKDFKLGNFYLRNIIKYQLISNDSVLPLPAFMSAHTLFYQNEFFKSNLLIQTGITYRFIGEYTGYGYFPENSSFTLQNNPPQGKFGYLDFFFKFRIQHARVFAKVENILGNQFKPEGMMVNDYPIPGRVFKLGLSWALFN
jgi:hypothetical protein